MGAKRKTDSKDKPYTANYPPLAEWLRAIEAVCNWQVATGHYGGEPTAYVESWITPGGEEFIVLVRWKGHGWNVFTGSRSQEIDKTIADANERLGVTKGPELPANTMGWIDVGHFIAQGAINIDEGHTTIEPGSKVHRAMHDFCTHMQAGTIRVVGGEEP